MATFEMSPEKYIEKYIYGKKERISRNIKYGSDLAEGLKDEEATGDPLLDLVMVKLPKYERMDLPIEYIPPYPTDGTCKLITFERTGQQYCIPILKIGKEKIPLLAVPDTAKVDLTAFKEYKTSVRKWTQKMADESGQITFYATAIWLITKKIPENIEIELVNIPLYYDELGRLHPTGEIIRLTTKRTMVDIIKMISRIRKAWAGIKKLCKNELL